MIEATYFYEKADQLLRLVKYLRVKAIDTGDVCGELEALANEFMRKAVELDESPIKRRSDAR